MTDDFDDDDDKTPVELGAKLKALTRDIRRGREVVGDQEARFLVNMYYQLQDHRIRAAAQARELSDAGTPGVAIAMVKDDALTLEKRVKNVLDAHSMTRPPGVWARSITGIGPVLAAGLMAHTHMEHCPTVGHLWAFMGFDPSKTWEKGKKRPWNADFKLIGYKIGESFVKCQNRDSDEYGRHYRERKAYEAAKNERKDYIEQAEKTLRDKKFDKKTEAYKWYSAGMLPPARIHARARRYAVKIFIAHWHYVNHLSAFGEPPPKPYVIAHGDHAHMIEPPNLEVYKKAAAEFRS